MGKPNDQLVELRTHIDSLDEQMLRLLAERMATVREVGQYKQTHALEPLDQERWQTVLNERLALAKSLGLAETVVSELYRLIHEYALRIERET